jgi:CO/xanthine dehydrogenase Mo-binding subunit
MVLAAKALLDRNPEPDRAAVKKAIRGNICRCTGYKKIEDAILLAAKFFRENLPVPEPAAAAPLSKRFQRVDAAEKILGTGLFADDLTLPDMIYAKALRSRYPRARVNKINVDKALRHPDTVRILTARDVPNNKTGHIKKDWDVMIAEGDVPRYIGAALALVATKSKETLDEVLSLIEVDYTVLEPVTSTREALKAGAPELHSGGNVMRREVLRRGNADEAIRNSRFVVTRRYSTPFQEHAFMEPECAVAAPDGEGGLVLYTGSQSVYDEQHEISRMLGIPPDKVRSRSMLVGGGFRKRLSVSTRRADGVVYAASVKSFSRQGKHELSHEAPRDERDFTTACDEEGNLTA